MEKKNYIWQTVAVVAIVISAITLIALCFYEWQSPEVYSQGLAIVISAALGAILTAIITRMVIGSQLKSEQEKEMNIKIYQMKLEVYSKFISDMWKLLDDGKLDNKEFLYLRSEVFNKLIFMLKQEDFPKMINYIESLRESVAGEDENEGDQGNILKLFGRITRLLREDIQNLSSTSEDKNLVIPLWNAFSYTSAKECQEKDTEEHHPIEQTGEMATPKSPVTYWHMNMVNRSIQQEALKKGIYELSLIEYGEEKRTNALKLVNKGDLIFPYNKGNMFLGIFEAVGRRIFYYDGESLKEEYVADLNHKDRPLIIDDKLKIDEDVKIYDIYGGIEDSADYCSNLIVKPLACMHMPKDDDVAAYRPTICRYDKQFGERILNKYKEALVSNNEEFGKIDGVDINCDTQTFLNLFK